jgi:hypothetical protein
LLGLAASLSSSRLSLADTCRGYLLAEFLALVPGRWIYLAASSFPGPDFWFCLPRRFSVVFVLLAQAILASRLGDRQPHPRCFEASLAGRLFGGRRATHRGAPHPRTRAPW